MMKENISLNNKHILFLKCCIDFHFCLGCTKPKQNIALILKIIKYWIIYKNVEELEIKLPTFIESPKKQESSRKTSTSALLTMPKPLTVWITINCGKFLKNGNIRPPDLPPRKSVFRSRSKLKLDMEQMAGFKSEKEYVKSLYIVTLLI